QRREIAHRIEPPAHIVERLVALPVAGGAAHVRRGDGVAARDEVLRERREARREPWEPLRLGPAVHRHDDRKRSLTLRLEQEHGHPLAVEALEAMQGRFEELLLIVHERAGRQTRYLVRA